MIRLTRDRTQIRAGFRGSYYRSREQRLLRERQRYSERLVDYEQRCNRVGPTERLPPRPEMPYQPAKWGQAKGQLVAEANGKCAYCEWHIGSSGQIDHFRPRALYWWLAYCYDNLVWACSTCHSNTYKGDRFPVTRRMGEPAALPLGPDPVDDAAVAAHLTACAAEAPALPDPYTVKIERYISWEADDIEKVVRIGARDVEGAQSLVDTLRATLGLDRDELARYRYTVYKPLQEDYGLLQRHGHLSPDASIWLGRLRDARAPSGQFAAMMCYFIDEIWQVDFEAWAARIGSPE